MDIKLAQIGKMEKYYIIYKYMVKNNKKDILPPISSDISLSKYGYKVAKTFEKRKKSLNRACKVHGTIIILKRLNLIRNYSKSKEDVHKRMSKDVKYLVEKYQKEKDKN